MVKIRWLYENLQSTTGFNHPNHNWPYMGFQMGTNPRSGWVLAQSRVGRSKIFPLLFSCLLTTHLFLLSHKWNLQVITALLTSTDFFFSLFLFFSCFFTLFVYFFYFKPYHNPLVNHDLFHLNASSIFCTNLEHNWHQQDSVAWKILWTCSYAHGRTRKRI